MRPGFLAVDLQFPFPATVAWMGQVLTLCCSTAYARLILPPAQRKPMSLKKYVPTVMFTSFCNLAYLYLSVAFIQMLKICSPVLTMLLGFLAKIKEATPRLVGALLVTGGGVVLATYGQLPLSLPGLACMMASGLAEGVHGVLAVSLQMVSDEQVRHPLEILMYVSSGCTLWLTVQVVFWELWPLLSARAYLIPLRHPVHFFAAATFSMAVAMLNRPFFKRCSSLTCWVRLTGAQADPAAVGQQTLRLTGAQARQEAGQQPAKVLATVKDASLVAIGVLVLHEHVSEGASGNITR
ncbi:hypothetical protein V8C86DRAFT_3182733 [Haematococcus lacustris]